MPLLIGGSACGALKTDHHYQALGGENTSKVLMSLIKAMDINVASFGADEGYVTEPLTSLFT